MRLALSRNLFTSKWMKFHIAFLTMLLTFPLTQLMAVEKYSNPKEVNDQIHQIKKSAPKLINIKELTQSPGGTPLLLLEIGTENKSNIRLKPAIMIVGNMEGKHLHATEAALFLAKKLANKQELLDRFNWYILPQGNPDAAERSALTPSICRGQHLHLVGEGHQPQARGSGQDPGEDVTQHRGDTEAVTENENRGG